jgi:hypothetical protein
MEELYLIYVNKLGVDWMDQYIYEFIFTDDIENVDGEDWDAVPASGRPSPPNAEFVKMVGTLTSTKLKFKLVQDSSTFSVWDAVDKVVALAWEDMDGYDDYPEHRLYLPFGDSIQSVKDKLLTHDMVLENNKKFNSNNNEN